MAGVDCYSDFTCGAKTRRGTYCEMMPVPGKKRCRLHGGLSTGPKTEEGRRRIAEEALVTC
ncbi:MAG: HGGxSTG domain-containing protein [Pseudomonadota bacterium]